MSHIVEVEATVKNQKFIEKVCQELNIRHNKVTDYEFYDGTIKSGTAIYLKGWRFPAVIEESGSVYFDNYNGSWGDIEKFHEFMNLYSLEEVKEQFDAKKIKYSVKKEKGKLILEAEA